MGLGEGAVSLAVCVIAVAGVTAVLLSTPVSSRNFALPVLVIGSGAFFSVGLADLAQAREPRFARALILSGVLWVMSALTVSNDPVAYSVGRVWLFFACLSIVYLVLSYPSGRLATRAERGLFAGGAVIMGLLYLLMALLGALRSPSLWPGCTLRCPQDAVAVIHATPTFVRLLVTPLREILTVGIFGAVAVVAVGRAVRPDQLSRQLHTPVAAFAALQAGLWALYFSLRALAPASGAVATVGWLVVLLIPSMALACAAGRLLARTYASIALERMASNLKVSAEPVDVRRALANALDDRSLRLYTAPLSSGGWIDECGEPADGVCLSPGQMVTQIFDGRSRIAIAHAARLAEVDDLVQSAGAYALLTLEKNSLIGELDRSLDELAESRHGRLEAERYTRQKIERDLHDGAQQRLVALRMKLALITARLEKRDPAEAGLLRSLGGEIDAAIDEVRSLAGGIYPTLLARTGLVNALRAAAREASVPAIVQAQAVKRHPPELEAALYFCCSEALQNACKHARGATRITISICEDRELHFEVRDDGAGFDLSRTPRGAGLANLGDRMGAVGGSVRVQSAPGDGTVVSGSVPLPPSERWTWNTSANGSRAAASPPPGTA